MFRFKDGDWSMNKYDEAIQVLAERFGHDNLISLATMDNYRPYLRIINGYYEEGSFYAITYALSNKMKQIETNSEVALCAEWFTAHGVGENIGWILDERNALMTTKLREIFAAWYDNGHINENDPNTCILRVRLTDGVLFNHGIKYELDFVNRIA